MDGSFDPYEEFRRLRAELSDASPESRVRGDIDDMLESIDRVFRNDAEESAWRDASRSHSLALSTLRQALTEILRQLERLDVLTAPQPLGRNLSEFIGATRVRAHALLQTVGPEEDLAPVAGSIEIELGFDDLHEFMLCPDLGCWCDAAQPAG